MQTASHRCDLEIRQCRCGLSRCFGVFVLALFAALAAPVSTHAQVASPSSGCTSANNGVFDVPTGTLNSNFNAVFADGEILTFTLSVVGGGTVPSLDINDTTSAVVVFSGNAVPDGTTASRTIPSAGSRSFTIAIGADEVDNGSVTVRCTPSTTTQQGPMRQNLAVGFMTRRLDRLVYSEPDRPRYLRRIPGTLWGKDASKPVLSFSTNHGGERRDLSASLTQFLDILNKDAAKRAAPMQPAVLGFDESTKLNSFGRGIARKENRVRLSLSLSQIRSALKADSNLHGANAVNRSEKASAFGEMGAAPDAVVPRGGVDVWIEGHYTGYSDAAGRDNRDGDVGVLYLGADFLLAESVLAGVLVQLDKVNDEGDQFDTEVEGEGYMAGPYISVRLLENLFFDARAAWGQSDNDIRIDTVTGNFDTERWLARANFSGNIRKGNWRVTPEAAAVYVEESKSAFTDSAGVRVGAKTVALGRVTFGPEFAYRHVTGDKGIVEPHLKLQGVWDFEAPSSPIAGGAIGSQEDIRARVEGGVLMQYPSGLSLRTVGAYDGIGADGFEAWSARAWLNVPLN